MKIMINYQIRACCPQYTSLQPWLFILLSTSVIFVNENENENYQKRKNNDFINEN